MFDVCILVVNNPPGQQQAPNPLCSVCGTWKPRMAPKIWDSFCVSKAYGHAGLGGWKKQKPGCNGLDTGLNIPGTKVS